MAIEVTCPNGHLLRVKDKYAGKRGYCPFCPGKVAVLVPHKLSDNDIAALIGKPAPTRPDPVPDVDADEDDSEDSASVLDTPAGEASSISLVGASAIRHRATCPDCDESVPYWFAKCPRCGKRLDRQG